MAIQEVPVDLIDSNPFQPRQDNSPEALEELAADISRNGLIHPPVARAVNGRYQLACGHRRVAACRALGWQVIPVDIRNLSDQDMALMAWSENESRRDLNPLERAEAIRRMMETFGWTQEQAGQHLGLARSTIANILRLLDLRPEVQEALRAGRISERQALALAPLSELNWEQVEQGNWVRRRVTEFLEGKREMSSDELRNLMSSAREEASGSLSSAIFDQSECTDCPKRKKTRCFDLECFRHKTREEQDRKLAEASRETGISIWQGEDRPTAIHYLFPDAVEIAQAKGCPHLRLAPGLWRETEYTCECGAECECAKEAREQQEREFRARQEEVKLMREALTRKLALMLEACDQSLIKVLFCVMMPHLAEKISEHSPEWLRGAIASHAAYILITPYGHRPAIEEIVRPLIVMEDPP